jgi:HAE1 family hydrophobic/amphiphilic exporter-1
MTITELAIKRPSLIVVIFAVLSFLGAVSYSFLNYELIPKFTAPIVFVNTIYPGANPNEVENSVTKPLEDVLSSLGGINLIQGTSSEGVSTVIMEFSQSTDIEVAINEASRKIEQIIPTLPNDVRAPVVSKFSSDEFPVLNIGATAISKPTEFYDLIKNQVQPTIAQVPGVGQVTIVGGIEREIKVSLLQDKLESFNISSAQVLGKIQMSNIDFPTGKVKNDNQNIIIRLAGKFTSVDQLANTIISNKNGQNIYLRDIAVVEDSEKDQETINRVNGKESIGLLVLKQSDANAVAVSEGVRAQLDLLSNKYKSQGLSFDVASDTSEFTIEAVEAVNHDLLIAIILVALVCLVFLHSLRNAVIVMIAIPTSLVVSFIGMYLFGFTLNLMTLLAMSLVVGILVDDSIVVLENIYRHLEMGKSSRQASIDGRNEIGFTALSITLVDVVVFVPIALTGGIVGNIMKSFAWVVVISTLMSLFVSFTITPLLASRFSKLTLYKKGSFGDLVFGTFEKGLDAFTNWYADILKFILRRWWVAMFVIIGGCGTFFSSFGLINNGYIGTDFIAQTDRGEFIITVELPKDASLRETNLATLQAEEYLRKNKDVVKVFSNVGRTTGIVQQNTSNKSEINVKLVPKDQREGQLASDLYAKNIRNDLEREIPGAKFRYTPVSFFGGADEDPLQVVVSSPNYEDALKYGNLLRDEIAKIPGAVETRLNVDEASPEIKVNLDRRKIAELGLDVATVGQNMQVAFAGNKDSKYREGAYEYDINIQMNSFDRRDIDDVKNLTFLNNRGEKIYLYQIADITQSTGPSALTRRDRIPAVVVRSQILGRALGEIGEDVKSKVAELNLPSNVNVFYEGNLKQQSEGFGTLLIAMAAAILFMYLIMVALYDDYVYPFVVMFSLPVAVSGALLALALSMKVMDIFTMLGLIMLMGLVGKNAILLVDFANKAKEEGMSTFDALIESGKTRMRPILMTTIAMVFGMMPIALAQGAGAEWKNGLAWAIIGGLTSSMILTLVVVPSVYLFVDYVGDGFERVFNKLGIPVRKKHKEVSEPKVVEDLTV